MRSWWRSFSTRGQTLALDRAPDLARIRKARETFALLTDAALADAARVTDTVHERIGLTAVVASRVLGVEMFDEQLQAAIELTRGCIVEMQTGEGKTLAAVPAVAWLARAGDGVHVLTVNDYLARRDAAWMGGIYQRLGLTVGVIQQGMSASDRRQAYRADITYATANEVGFDYLRDGLATDPAEQVHRSFGAALIDEADSILLDEARVPLVIAGGGADEIDVATRADQAARQLRAGHDYAVEGHARNVLLTPAGVQLIERLLGCGNLFDDEWLAEHTAVQDALHAHVLLRRDVDYVVSDDAVQPVDEFKGRIVADRRWPAGLQTALEVKEGVRRRRQGRVLGSITVENLVSLYAGVSGMTGTAATQARDFRDAYTIDVRVIQTHRPVIRVDHPDEVFDTLAGKDAAIQREIRAVHPTGRPVLVGTASVEESERLSRALGDIPHHVLNARNEAAEAAIIARAGERGAVTISTNMAGRGVDIRLGDGVAAFGGLHVIGTNRHDSRRIDDQLRGRAGRQGDPGSSRFFISFEDPLWQKYSGGDRDMSPDQCQRVAEGEHLEIRLFLRRYESVIEAQRRAIADRRQDVLEAAAPAGSIEGRDRLVRLAAIDELWSDYLAAIAELRSGAAWISLGYGDALGSYLREIHAMFAEMTSSIDAEVEVRIADLAPGAPPPNRGATWTYLTHDEPFGRMTERIVRGLLNRRRARRT